MAHRHAGALRRPHHVLNLSLRRRRERYGYRSMSKCRVPGTSSTGGVGSHVREVVCTWGNVVGTWGDIVGSCGDGKEDE